MATSTLTIYKTNIEINKNFKVDQIDTYLGTCEQILISNFQYQKISLDMVIKVDMDQSKVSTQDIGNYVSIAQDNEIFYFFVTDYKWISPHCVAISLFMDTINTFDNNYTLSDKTYVIREHRNRCRDEDRYNEYEGGRFHKVVDNVDEGLGEIIKFQEFNTKVLESPVEDSFINQNWYLAYISNTTNAESKPFDVYLYPKKDNVPYSSGGTGPETWHTNRLIQGVYYFFLVDDNSSLTQSMVLHLNADGTKIERSEVVITGNGEINLIDTYETSSVTFNADTYYHTTNAIIDLRFADILRSEAYFINASSPTTKFLASIDTLDRSNTQIANIIELPYLPSNIKWNGNNINLNNTGWELINDIIHLIDLDTEFERTIKSSIELDLSTSLNFGSKEIMVNSDKDKEYESKLLNSNFFEYKLAYDTFASTIDFERITREQIDPKYSIKFKPSNTLTSELGFKWDFSNATYKFNQDYENYILSNRENTIGLYNSEYLNYMRNGYNYDKKAKNLAAWSSGINVGSTVATGLLLKGISSTGLGPVGWIGFGISTAVSVFNGISSTIQNQQAFEQNIKSKQMQAASIQNANSIDIFNWYNGNKLHIFEYKPSEKMENLLFDLFYYTGYSTNQQKQPDLNTRYWFNYIQADAILNVDDLNQVYINDIIDRYKTGITVLHYHNGYDWTQSKENWENSLFGE